MRIFHVALASGALLVGACATVPPTSEELASCRQMEGEMGLGTRHDHDEMKGRGLNPMNLSHQRCMEILKQ
jgi:hypothetical protein